MYIKISGAGLPVVALFLALVISPVVSIPIPLPSQSPGLSFSSRSSSGNELDLIYRGSADSLRIQPQTSPISTASTIKALTHNNADDPQLVRRNSKLNAKIRAAFKKFGQKVKKGFQKAGNAIKKGFQKAGNAIKKGFQKMGKGIKKAAKAVVKFMKTTGKKIAKFGLKIVQSVGMVVGKVVGFIPGFKGVGKAIGYVAKAAGMASDHIHANLGGKLDKGMNIMNKANKIMGFIPRRRDLSEEEVVQRRESGDGYYFEERDDIVLEHREESYFDADSDEHDT